LQPLNFLTP